MKTKLTRIFCIVISLLLVLQAVVILAACDKTLDPNKTPLVLSTDALDGVFNPFSYTSGADGGVVGQTQLGMLNIATKGIGSNLTYDIVAGWDQPTVAEAYSVVPYGDLSWYEDNNNYDEYYTDYYFVIKDGIKFSDGTELTIKDVLFNLYVYLDPVYTGSSTMYSTAIQGLSEYRTQEEGENAQSQLNTLAQAKATDRLLRLINWCSLDDNSKLEDYGEFADPAVLAEVKEDIAKIQELFLEELNTDWVAAASMVEEFEKYYDRNENDGQAMGITSGAEWAEWTKEGNKHRHISQQWEVFLIMYGQISTYYEKLADGTKKYTFDYNGYDKLSHGQEDLVTATFTDFFPKDESGQKFKQQLATVLTAYATSNSFYEYAVNDAKQKILNEGERQFTEISGIKVYKANSIPASTVSSGATTFDSERTILNIRINGVDPKALMSFSFSVAPMHYYSEKAQIDKFVETYTTQEEIAGEMRTVQHYEGFGVDYANPKFMDKINKKLVPMGAGPYRPSNGTEKGLSDLAMPSRGVFFSNNIVNFERNNYFYTVMKGGHNANIKFLRYKVTAANQMVDAVTGKNPEVHVSTPSATAKVNQEVRKLSGVQAITVDYMGYGYIGVNADKVHNIYIRRAIMHAMDTSLVLDYYGSSDLVSRLYRSMSTNSWAYPETATEPYYEFWSNGQKILEYIQENTDFIPNNNGTLYDPYTGDVCKFTFTVAGDTEDHPAYQTMYKAAQILNNIGFDITVTKDTQALSKLASGGLEIWAAAWSSAIDPDMYQVYHKDSTASSVKNWGYPYLLRDGSSDEKEILDKLARAIEEGRKYLDEDERKPWYEEALDLVMDLAVELPTYQRKDMYLINSKIVDVNTLCEANMYQSPLSEIWNVNFVGAK